MLKYAKVINETSGLCEVGIGTNSKFYKSIGMELQDVTQSDIDGLWYLSGYAPMKTDEEKQQEEKERIAKLSLTRGDVFRGILQAKGVTKEQIAQMIEAMPATNAEEILKKELAKIDFEDALNYYRGVDLINTIGFSLGLTEKQLDNFFIKGNDPDTKAEAYKELTSVTLEIETVPEDCLIKINEQTVSSLEVPYNSFIKYIVSKEGFKSAENSFFIKEDTLLKIELETDEVAK